MQNVIVCDILNAEQVSIYDEYTKLMEIPAGEQLNYLRAALLEDETLADTAQQLARHLATQPTFGLGLIKQAINSAETNTLDTQLDLERDYQRLAGRSADYREGVSAFLAKRSPQFTGK